MVAAFSPDASAAWDQAPVDSYQFVVTEREHGSRLDQYLSARELPHSRSQVKRHIAAHCCTVNAEPARPAKRLRSGDVVAYRPPPLRALEVAPEAIPLSILYEDELLIVLDKPPGMVVHPAPGHASGTLVSALLAHCKDLSGIGGVARPGIVHRLDKLTSGVMVAAKQDQAHRALAAQFSEHTIERRYLALVWGCPDPPESTISTLHARHPTDRKRFTSRCERGRSAITHYRVIERLGVASLVEARLETGRTHQVRVHFADRGHPLLGDPVYGRAPVDRSGRAIAKRLARQALHAHLLAFEHPLDGTRLRFVAPPPADMQAALAALKEVNS